MRIYAVVPTFRESELVLPFLESWENVATAEVEVVVVNGNPGDETSKLISSWEGVNTVREIEGHHDLFWTGLVSLGLRDVSEKAGSSDFFLLTNIDVRLKGDAVASILEHVENLPERQVAIPVMGGSGKLVSAGVKVLSWPLSRNRHLYDGWEPGRLPENAITEATFLPTRFLLCPVEALSRGILPDAKRLPHYCADYEYSNRLRRNGYRPVIFTGASARLSEENTGYDTYLLSTTFWSRLKRINDIKCAYNFRYRFRFVCLTYPRWAILPGLVTHFAKIGLEILFGGKSLQRWRKQ